MSGWRWSPGAAELPKDRTSGGWSPPGACPYWARPEGAECRPRVFEDTDINSETTAPATGETRPGLRLDLFIEPGERIEGHVTIVGETVGVPFKGWVEFMAAVDSLRTRGGGGGGRDITVPVTGRPTEPAPRTRRQA